MERNWWTFKFLGSSDESGNIWGRDKFYRVFHSESALAAKSRGAVVNIDKETYEDEAPLDMNDPNDYEEAMNREEAKGTRDGGRDEDEEEEEEEIEYAKDETAITNEDGAIFDEDAVPEEEESPEIGVEDAFETSQEMDGESNNKQYKKYMKKMEDIDPIDQDEEVDDGMNGDGRD